LSIAPLKSNPSPFSDGLRLVLLSAIWGSSFLLMRVAAPEFGPVPLILVRSTGAALCFAIIFRNAEHRALFRRHLLGFFLLAIVNTALPFSLLAFSTLSLEAGFTSLLNATTPMFAALVGAVCFSTPLRRPQVIGLFIALAGVAILSWDSLSFKPGGSGLAVLAAIGASASYGIAVNVTKHRFAHVPPNVISAGTLLMASLILFVPGLLLWPAEPPSAKAWGCALMLAVVCTAVAYAIFFHLLARGGATATSSVTFLIPVFAILWGAAILGETVDSQLVTGMVVTLVGTALVIGLVGAKRRR
jgi:drug/metabolite transporter (DMT)-like permease